MTQSERTADLEEISSVSKRLEVEPDNEAVRRELLSKIDMFKRSVQRPTDLMDEHWITMSSVKAMAALIDYDVVQSIPAYGSVSAKQLAEQSGLNVEIIVRLMRFLTARGVITLEPDAEVTYSHTHLSRVWLQRNAVQHTSMMTNLILAPDVGLYLQTHAPEDIYNPSRCMSSWAAGCEGKNFFEYLSSDPKRLNIFNEALQYTEDFNPAFGEFPIEERLTNLDLPAEVPLFVDIGGGRGQSIKTLKSRMPEMKGRLINQDRPDVLSAIPSEDKEIFECMVHDFFTPQPVAGARIYHLRWIIHDWDDESALCILKQIVPAMSSSSRLLINDALLPERAVPGVDISSCWMDYAMMMIGGKERTQTEMVQMLQKAGLQHLGTWKSDYGTYSVIEAGLPDTQQAKL